MYCIINEKEQHPFYKVATMKDTIVGMKNARLWLEIKKIEK